MKRTTKRPRAFAAAAPDVPLCEVLAFPPRLREALARAYLVRTAGELEAAAIGLIAAGKTREKKTHDAAALVIRGASFYSAPHTDCWIAAGMALEALGKARARAEGGAD